MLQGTEPEPPPQANKDWAMEIYRGKDTCAIAEGTEDEGILELDLDEDEVELASRFLAIAVFYYQKSYSPQYLFLIC